MRYSDHRVFQRDLRNFIFDHRVHKGPIRSGVHYNYLFIVMSDALSHTTQFCILAHESNGARCGSAVRHIRFQAL